MDRADAVLRNALATQHLRDEDRLPLAAESPDVPRVGLDRRAEAMRVQLVAPRRDDHERVPPDRHRLDSLDHVHVHDLARAREPLAGRELRTVIDRRVAVIELDAELCDREPYVSAASDDETRSRQPRLAEWL